MIRAVLIDLSGTIHIENQVIPGAVEALRKLLETKLYIRFVTNTTKESQNVLHSRLVKLGFPVEKDQIFSSLSAAQRLLKSNNQRGLLLLSKSALEDFEGLSCPVGEKPDAVVVGLAPEEFHYERLNQAFNSLINGAQLIAIHAGKYYKRADGLALGPGCFVKGLEYSAQCEASVVGKPQKSFFLSALRPGIKPEEVVMIGDDVTDDVEGAMNAGMQAYLVKTGKYREGDENKISKPPDAVVASFVEAVELILSKINATSLQ